MVIDLKSAKTYHRVVHVTEEKLCRSQRSVSPQLPSFEDVTPKELIARAAEIAPTLVPLQAETEQRTHYSEETHRLFKEAGFYRILTPKRYGGLEFGDRHASSRSP